MTELRYPKIDGKTDAERIEQMRRYLFYLVDELQIIINNLPTKGEETEGNDK